MLLSSVSLTGLSFSFLSLVLFVSWNFCRQSKIHCQRHYHGFGSKCKCLVHHCFHCWCQSGVSHFLCVALGSGCCICIGSCCCLDFDCLVYLVCCCLCFCLGFLALGGNWNWICLLNYAPTLTTVRVSIILFNVMSFVAVLSTISLLTAVLWFSRLP